VGCFSAKFRLGRSCVSARLIFVLLQVCLLPGLCVAQAVNAERPVPILTGNAGFFTNVVGGQTQLVPEINPVILLPLGDRWLIESRGEFKGEFERSAPGASYGGTVEKELDYLQADFIANPYVTITTGRFLTPFGIYNERLYPIWIRSLQPTLPRRAPEISSPCNGHCRAAHARACHHHRGGHALHPSLPDPVNQQR